jgi:hypothetical protein
MKNHGISKAKSIETGEWVIGLYLPVVGRQIVVAEADEHVVKHEELIFDKHYILVTRLPDKLNWSVDDCYTAVEVDEETVCRGCELFNKLFFENDVVMDRIYGETPYDYRDEFSVIEYDSYQFNLCYYGKTAEMTENGWNEDGGDWEVIERIAFADLFFQDIKDLQIIGNIIDNPELIYTKTT